MRSRREVSSVTYDWDWKAAGCDMDYSINYDAAHGPLP